MYIVHICTVLLQQCRELFLDLILARIAAMSLNNE